MRENLTKETNRNTLNFEINQNIEIEYIYENIDKTFEICGIIKDKDTNLKVISGSNLSGFP